jgi:hypothetical protein
MGVGMGWAVLHNGEELTDTLLIRRAGQPLDCSKHAVRNRFTR